MYTKLISLLSSVVVVLALTLTAHAHELTPTYPSAEPSYMDGVSKVTLTMFNRREDAKFYQIDVFDAEFNPIEFATTSRILEINYLKRKTFEVYFKSSNANRIPTFICTTSKLEKENQTATVIESRVCSKIK